MSESSFGRTFRACVWGVLVGAAAGFSIGLLTAPEEGRRMRRRLAYQLEALGHRVSTYVDDVTTAKEAGEARREGDQVVADAEDRAQAIRQDIDALLGEMRQHRAAN